ncbi:MAG: hypothetical protein EXS16_01935 [Gemmataceae bacterium]|nr:hypothetical protein [Gemmataceae bacterium]
MILECPQCKTKVKIPDEAIEKKARCPRCKTVFVAEAPVEVDVEVMESELEEPVSCGANLGGTGD